MTAMSCIANNIAIFSNTWSKSQNNTSSISNVSSETLVIILPVAF